MGKYIITQLVNLFHVHQWVNTEAVYNSILEEKLALTLMPATRTCSKCGKFQIEDKHCLGLTPPTYVSRWYTKID